MEKVSLGADPEWGILNKDGKLIRPSDVISETLECERFGIDGSGRVAELRPKYGYSPDELVNNIKTLMQDGLNANPALAAYRWKAGSMAEDEPIGGHVHLGHSDLIRNSRLNIHKVSLVETALTRIVSPLLLMCENRDEAISRRVGTGYGAMKGENCIRDQVYGIEYRTLASWLTSPDDARAVLSLVHLIAVNLNNEEFLHAANGLPEMDDEAFTDCNKAVTTFFLSSIAKVLKAAEGFKSYLPNMSRIFDMIIERKEFDTEKDMKVSWGLKLPKLAEVTV